MTIFRNRNTTRALGCLAVIVGICVTNILTGAVVASTYAGEGWMRVPTYVTPEGVRGIYWGKKMEYLELPQDDDSDGNLESLSLTAVPPGKNATFSFVLFDFNESGSADMISVAFRSDIILMDARVEDMDAGDLLATTSITFRTSDGSGRTTYVDTDEDGDFDFYKNYAIDQWYALVGDQWRPVSIAEKYPKSSTEFTIDEDL